MAKRWSAEDIKDLRDLAEEYSAQAIAEKMDRTVGGVAFKAHQLGVPLNPRSQLADADVRGSSSDRHRQEAADV